jgi:glycosyltransferase involved in cell wall biosynthesis
MKPLVSILIPAYNAQQWIADTIRSALSQTWEPKEIIVIDDGSTDKTLNIARRFESQGVHVVSQQNESGAAARNKAFSLCTGDYIQWLDDDDLLAPDKIERQMYAAGRCGSKRTLLSSSWGYFMFRIEGARFVPTALWCDLSPAEFLLRKMEQNLFMQTSAWLVSRELTEAAGPWDTSLLIDDDGEYFCRVLLACDAVHFVPHARTYWRRSGLAQTSFIGFSDGKLESQWRSMRLHIDYLRSLEDTPAVRAACVKFLQNWMVRFYPERIDIFEHATRIARDLGGDLTIPAISPKYSWMRSILGVRIAKRAQFLLPQLRWSVIRLWDRMLFRIQN